MSGAAPSDQDLAARADSQAIEALYQRHSPALLAWLTARAYDPEDLLQETWLRVCKQLPAGFQGGNFRAWLFVIARNLLIDRVRRPRALPLDGSEPAPVCEPWEELLEKERQTILSKCLVELEQRDPRAGLLARGRLRGEPYEELAAQLSLRTKQVHRLWHTVLKNLQACVGRSKR
jgi:RNA polymerase sigma-70 factor (ECF subfamily)